MDAVENAKMNQDSEKELKDIEQQAATVCVLYFRVNKVQSSN